MTAGRVSIFEEDEIDLSDFETSKTGQGSRYAPPDQVRQVAEAAAFRSREPTLVPVYRRYRTGRNVQLNIKVRQDTLDAFNKLCDMHGWVQGETLQRALSALERELATDGSPPSPQ